MVKTDFGESGDQPSDNPYATPDKESIEAYPNQLNGLLWRAVATIVGSMILVGLLGACGGMLLGTLAPGYYEMVFQSAPGGKPVANPARLGLALGAMQGTGVGFLVGSVAVFAVAFYRSRVAKQLK